MRAAARSLVVAALGLAACTGGDGPSPTTTATTTTTELPRVDDGVLRIGVLLPSTGDGLDIGQPAIDGVRLAVSEINAAGGVEGRPVELVMRDEGDDAIVTARSLEQILDAEVDAIVGPASSNTALAVLADIVDEGVVTCSPTATSLALDGFPDDDLFFRTAPSDSLQAVAVARTIEATGRTPVALAYLDDGWGRPIATEVEATLRSRGIDIAAVLPFTTDEDDLARVALDVMGAAPGTVAVIGDADSTFRLSWALNGSSGPTIVVTDAARRPASLSLLESMPAEIRTRIVGVSPTATPSDELLRRLRAIRPESTGLFAANAYDCANLIALGARSARSTDPRLIAAEIVQVGTSGSSCADFASCAQLLANDRNIDYDGPSGTLMIGASGDAASGRFDRFGFDEEGRDRTVAQFTVTTS